MFRQIKRNRRIVAGTAIAMLVVAATLMAIGQVSGNGPGWLASLAIVAALVLPAAYALISLDRRPSLLPVAVMGALVAGVLMLESLPVWVVAAVVWGLVARSRPRPAPEPQWARFGRPLLAAAVAVPMLLMFGHLDPVCTTTYADGRVEQVDPATRGYETGWGFGIGVYTTGTESVSEIATESCSSNTVVWWEAVVSLAASAGIVALAYRWPTGEQLTRPASPLTPASVDR